VVTQTNLKLASPRLRQIKAGAEAVPGVTTFDTAGHTPGHMSVHISSGREEMLLTGDVVADPEIGFLHPEWAFGFDLDVPLATKARMAFLDRAAADKTLVGSYHLPFPGFGHVVREGSGYRCRQIGSGRADDHTQRRTSMNTQDDLQPRYPMNRRAFVGMVAAGAASTLFQGSAAAAAPVPKARNVVLVHGLFADGSSWSEVIARLQAAGLNATSVQNPLTTLPDAVASAERVLARQDGPTVMVGHSFSGMIVTEAGIHPNVSALVYVAARAPDAGEDYTALAKTFPTPPASAGVVFDGDEGRLTEAAFLRDFAGDLPEAKAKVLYAVQEPFQKALLAGKTTHAAWRSKPSFYAVSTEDRTINPDLERFMAKRMGAKTIEVKASHLSLISQPDEITQLILEAAG
jgi:pimeloyl-ACP methyl ester carboxylesterase